LSEVVWIFSNRDQWKPQQWLQGELSPDLQPLLLNDLFLVRAFG